VDWVSVSEIDNIKGMNPGAGRIEKSMNNGGDKLSRQHIRTLWSRFLPGALLAAALILIEAGIGAFMIARNTACWEKAEQMRNRFVSSDMCVSEEAGQLAETMLRGPFFMMNAEIPALTSLAVTVLFYGVIGGGVSVIRSKWGWPVFLLIHLLLLGVGVLFGILRLYSG